MARDEMHGVPPVFLEIDAIKMGMKTEKGKYRNTCCLQMYSLL